MDAPQDDVQKMSAVIDLGTAVCVCMICMHHYTLMCMVGYAWLQMSRNFCIQQESIIKLMVMSVVVYSKWSKSIGFVKQHVNGTGDHNIVGPD